MLGYVSTEAFVAPFSCYIEEALWKHLVIPTFVEALLYIVSMKAHSHIYVSQFPRNSVGNEYYLTLLCYTSAPLTPDISERQLGQASLLLTYCPLALAVLHIMCPLLLVFLLSIVLRLQLLLLLLFQLLESLLSSITTLLELLSLLLLRTPAIIVVVVIIAVIISLIVVYYGTPPKKKHRNHFDLPSSILLQSPAIN